MCFGIEERMEKANLLDWRHIHISCDSSWFSTLLELSNCNDEGLEIWVGVFVQHTARNSLEKDWMTRGRVLLKLKFTLDTRPPPSPEKRP